MTISVISDMDGVIYRGKELIAGVQEFIQELKERKISFIFITNNSEQTPLDLKLKLEERGIPGLTEENFITSAMATAKFLQSQKPNGTAYVIGGAGLVNELYNVGYSITETNPDYVVVGKTKHLNFDMLKKAVNLIQAGSKFIATNPDIIDPVEDGIEPACGSIIAAIETASGKKPYVVGKPNPLMIMIAKKMLGAHSADTLMIGDRMDTDIITGLESGMKTCLVLSGVTNRDAIDKFPYCPTYVYNNVGEIDLDELIKSWK